MTAIPPVDGLTIGAALRRAAERRPGGEALVFPQAGFRVTYAELDARVDAVARSLLALGIGRGDHVAVWATNWPEWTLLFMATCRVGAVLVTVNPAYRTHDLVYALQQSELKALFLIDRFKASDYFGMIAEVRGELPSLASVFSMKEYGPEGIPPWPAFLDLGRAVPMEAVRGAEAATVADDPANLQYTSGTTGFPKGVLLSHRSLLLNGWYIGECQRLGPEDRVCVPVPFYHCFGIVIGTLCCMVRECTMLVPREHFEAAATLDCVERERATALYGVPTMFVAELEHETFAGRDLSSLRTGVMAGSPCPIEIMNRVVGDMGAREMTIAYGLTEASPVITETLADDPVEIRVRTVGRPLPGVEVRVVDPASGRVLPDGESGELQARGHNVMLGYFRMPEATAETILEGGWLRTGDLAVREANGYYRITGRIKDMIIRGGGEHLSPRDRGIPLHPPRRGERPGRGRARPEVRRGGVRVDQAPPRGDGHGRRDPLVLQEPPGVLQGPPVREVRGRVPADGDGEGPEVPHPREGDRGVRAGPRPRRRGLRRQDGRRRGELAGSA